MVESTAVRSDRRCTAGRPPAGSAPATCSPPRSAASGGRCSPATTSTRPRIFDEAGIPVLLVGDSAANNVFGYETTLPVTVDELLPLVRAVVRATRQRAGRRRPAVRLVRGGSDAGAAHRRCGS